MVRTTADDEFDEQLLADIEQYGWHLVAIDDGDEAPAYVFSVGIYQTLGHPEICIFGLNDLNVMGQIVNEIGQMVRAGQTFQDWEASGDVLAGHDCLFRTVSPRWYQEFFGYDRWYYEGDNFPMLQCVWPDREGKFPWEPGFETGFLEAQPILAAPSDWPFTDAKNRLAFTTRQVIEQAHPILLVSHDADGDWQFLCGGADDEADGRVVCLKNIVADHPSVAELADLPVGWRAFRESPHDPWQRASDDC